MKNMFRQNLAAFVSGLLFAIGLVFSGMTQPQKILGFLDFFGNWDPSLMFVMIGAISVHMLAYRFIARQKTPVFATQFHVPNSKEITKQLVIGSALFGLGWGLGGFCPGPSLTAASAGSSSALLFVVAMVLGMFGYRLYERFKFPKTTHS